jgi:exosortase
MPATLQAAGTSTEAIKVAASGPSLDRPTAFLLKTWPLFVLGIAVAILYGPVLAGLVRQWYTDPNYSHGFLVPIFSGYLIWRKRNDLAARTMSPSASGFFLAIISIALLALGTLGAELFLQRISLLTMTVALFTYFLGWPKLRAIAFPIGMLLFAIPLPVLLLNQIVFPLQLLASRLATIFLEIINVVPVLREGNLLILPNYTLEVVEACSGIRSLVSLLAFASSYVFLAEDNLLLRSLLVATMVPLAVFCNAIRVAASALFVHYLGPRAAEGFLHSFSGWVIFVTATILLLTLHGMITWVSHGQQRRKLG